MSTAEPVATPPHVERHVSLTFNDVADAGARERGLVPPSREHVDTILRLATEWDRAHPLLIHCWFGISRSPAAAIIMAAALAPERDAADLAEAARQVAPFATPNPRMIALADEVLERKGALIDAVEAIGRGAEASEGRPFVLYP